MLPFVPEYPCIRVKRHLLPLTLLCLMASFLFYHAPVFMRHNKTFHGIVSTDRIGNVNGILLNTRTSEQTSNFNISTTRRENSLGGKHVSKITEDRDKIRRLLDGPDGTNTTLCAEVPTTLVGEIPVMREHLPFHLLDTLFPEIHGWYEPPSCRARQRVAFIVPYRDNEQELRVLLHNIIPVLQRQMLDFTFFIVEQAQPSTFNPAFLFNIGFLEASKLRDYDCFVFYNIQTIPKTDRVMFTCGDNPKYWEENLETTPHSSGTQQVPVSTGLFGFTRPQFLRINGVSNLYFHFGGENEDIWKRIHARRMFIDRQLLPSEQYSVSVKTSAEAEEKALKVRTKLMKTTIERMDDDGLNSAKYALLNSVTSKLFVWFNVAVDVAGILEKVPNHVKSIIISAFSQ